MKKLLSEKPTFEEFNDLMSSDKDIELDDDAFDAVLCKRLDSLKTKSPVQFSEMEKTLENLKSEELPLEWDKEA